jgi:signal transduction histidine kinase/CheY-like chemotaxis protein
MSYSDPAAAEPATPLALVPWMPPTRERHLMDALARVHGERDEPGVLLAAVQSVERSLAGAAAAVFQVDPDAQIVSLRAAGPRWRTAERDAPAWLTRETGGIAGFARGGAASAGRWWRRPGATAEAVGSDIARVRIMVADELWGMLVVVRPSGDDDRGEDAWFIESLAEQVGLALRHAIERSELQRTLTASREARNRATREDRLSILGQLASGVAHDFNNALTSILGVTEWLLFTQTGDEDLSRELESIRVAATDAAALVKRLYYFARQKNAVPREVSSLRELAESSLDLVRTRLQARPDNDRPRIHLSIAADADASVEAESAALREVFVNLLTNAVDASPDGTDIVVRVGQEGDEAFAAVVDHGRGMDEETRGRVFEPFFSTKRSRGAGLGLSLCWSVIENHGGRIGVASSPGVGSTFTVWLPAVEPALRTPAESAGRVTDAPRPAPGPALAPYRPAAALRPAVVAVTGEAARILLIDDQHDVRDSVADMLRVLGYQAHAVATGDEAIHLADAEDFDLVITDLGMPGLNGLELARALHRDQPELPILLLTGWGNQYEGRPPADITRVVAKPVTLETLASIVRDVLAGHPGRAR